MLKKGCTTCIHGKKALRQNPCHYCYKEFINKGISFSRYKAKE
jgi:hypothetical protein